MRRRNISGKKHARKFAKMRNKTKRINEGTVNMRGGFRF